MEKKKKKDKLPKVKKVKAPKQGKKGIQFGLFAFLMGLALVPLTISIVVICVTSSNITKSNLEESTKETMYVVATNLAQYCSDNNITAMNASDYYDYLDNLKERGIEMAIVADGIPATTSIKNDNDFRVRDIPLPEGVMTNEAGTYSGSVMIDEKEYIGYYKPITIDGAVKAVAFAGELKATVMGSTKSIVTTFIILAVILIVASFVIALIFSQYLSTLFKRVAKHLDALSKGYLGEKMQKSTVVKEMSTLLGNASLMQTNLSETIGSVKTGSDNLADSVTEVTKLSQDTAEKVSQITESMDKLSASSSTMDENVRNISLQMEEIGSAVNEISENVEHLYASSKNLLQTNNDAKETMDVLMDSNKKSVDAVKDITDQISETNDSIAEIDKAVELILSIAQQTNLLSLNASIEAARAGEAGRGFAVVAGEIRNLSEQSAQGAEMIRNLSGEIRQKSSASVGYAKSLNVLIQEEKGSIANTLMKFEEHSKEIDLSVVEIQAIAEKTENLAQNKEKVVLNIQDLSAISEENANCNAEVNQNVEEIISQVGLVSGHCEQMNDLAQNLKESVSYFRAE